jgi:hypothetical protein
MLCYRANSSTRGVPTNNDMIIIAEYELVENPKKKGVFRKERGAELLSMLWRHA